MSLISTTNSYYKNLKLSALLLFLSLASFLFLPDIVSSANAATDINTEVSWKPIYLSLADGDAINFGSITPSENLGAGNNVGTMKVIKKNLSVSTNGKSAAVYFSMKGNSNSLAYNDNDSNISIPAINDNGTPTTFSDSAWGYATAGAADFAGLSLYSGPLDTQMTKTAYSTFYNTGVWAAVPLSGNEKKIWSKETTNANGFGTYTYNGTTYTGDSDNNFDVYYAVVVDDDLVAGTYTNKIVYTALASSDSLNAVSDNILVSNLSSNGISAATKRFTTNGDRLNLEFDLASTDTDFIKKSDVKIYLVPHALAANNNYSINSSNPSDPIVSGKNNYPVCTIGNNDEDFVITSSTTSGATINCTIENSASNSAPLIVSTTSANEKSDGYYDVWVNIENNVLKKNYLSKYLSSGSIISTLAFVGLQSHSDNNASSSNYVVSSMQDMTASVCKNTNMWGTGYGDSTRVYDYTGSGTALADSASGSAAIGTGTFLLADVRETVSSGGLSLNGKNYKSYLVRRLADGNCWMVQNLDYDLSVSSNRILNPATSDVASNKTLSNKNLSDAINSSCSEQYQSRGNFGTNCLWGSTKGGISVTANADSAFARSYNNLGYIDGTSTVVNRTECEKITSTSYDTTGAYCAMEGKISDTSSPSADGTTQDSTWQPEYISSSDSSTFTMRGSMYYGDYYNWYAATAESGNYNMSSANATESICPRGWRLPINGGNDTDKSWQHLINGAYGYVSTNGYNQNNRKALSKIFSLPMSIPLAGLYYWTSGALVGRGYYGYYWSSTATATGDGTNAYYLDMGYGGYVNPQDGDNKPYGLTVRCVAR